MKYINKSIIPITILYIFVEEVMLSILAFIYSLNNIFLIKLFTSIITSLNISGLVEYLDFDNNFSKLFWDIFNSFLELGLKYKLIINSISFLYGLNIF